MKTDNSKNIDALFRDKLEHVEYSQSESAWTVLEFLMRQQKRKRKLFLIRFFSSSAVLVALLFLWLNFFFEPERENISDKEYNAYSSALNATEEFRNNAQHNNENSPRMEKQNNNSSFAYSHNASGENHRSHLNTNSNSPETNAITAEHQPQSIFADVNNNKEEKSQDEYGYLESFSRALYIPWDKDSVKVQIRFTGKELNTPFPEYAPVINADGSVMYFTSRRPVTEKEKKKGITGLENIYFSSFNRETGKWTEALMLPAPVNFPGRFNSAVALSNDGQRLFLYRDDKFGNGDIYESVLQGNLWSEPQSLPEPINSQYHETSVTLSPDGNTLYFVSNRPGGKGEKDIWYCTKTKDARLPPASRQDRDGHGTWSQAKNLGSPVNSSKDEEGIFMHPDGKTLYFSSRGHSGRGGYDIFYTRLENGKWTQPVNLGPAINTPNDDVYFVVEANGQNAYYASIRDDGMGEKDIYKVTFIFPEKNKKNTAQLTLFKGNVLDKLTKQPLESDIELIDLEKGEQITTLKSNAATGAFMLSLPAGKNYAINVKKQNYLFYSENFNIPSGDEYKEVHKTVLLDQLRTGAKVVLKNIFYDYDKATLRPESKNELDRLHDLLLQNPNLKIELSAHTDSRGSNEYNLNLSQNRAQSCVDYLLSRGISKERIVAKGYGEEQPFVKEEEISKMTSENEKEAAHQLNRRTEIKIIEN